MVDYTARIKDGEVFDTTREADGRQAGLDPGKRYGPMLISVGEGWVLKGLDEAIAGAEADQDIRAEVPPEKGFGEASSSKIRVMRSRKLGEDEEKVSVGDEVEIDGKRGVVRLIASGRIKVDFNHKHAGKTLVYDARVVKELESDEEKISAILDRHLPLAKSHAFTNGLLMVSLDPNTSPPPARHAARADLFRLVPSVRTLMYTEAYENPAPSPAEPQADPGQDGSEPAGGEARPAGQDGPESAEPGPDQPAEHEAPAAGQDGPESAEGEAQQAGQDGPQPEQDSSKPAGQDGPESAGPEPQTAEDDPESDSVKFWSPDKG